MTCYVNYYCSNQGYIAMDPPVIANQFSCPFCNGTHHYTPSYDGDPTKKVWMCGRVCVASVLPKNLGATSIPPPSRCGQEWPLFCEINGIGDVHHNVRFEKIEQSQGKLDYLLKFATNPSGIILMQGGPGSGKTYASMGVCEYFTRKSAFATFITQTKMQDKWLSEEKVKFISNCERVNLLVIDDFGIGEISPGFMRFFFNLVDSRLQWTNKGTIITTNLLDKEFTNYCGQALNDRIRTGQKMVFENKSRRQQIIRN